MTVACFINNSKISNNNSLNGLNVNTFLNLVSKMGRKKIDIRTISDDRTRQVTFRLLISFDCLVDIIVGYI